MSGYLVDTDVISSSSPNRPHTPDLAAWMDDHAQELFISAVTVTEIEDGIAKLRRTGARRKAEALDAWFETLLHLYGERVLAFDAETARVAGGLSDRARGLGLAPGLADIIIAATARQCTLTLLTRNTRDFRPLGITTLDPFQSLPR